MGVSCQSELDFNIIRLLGQEFPLTKHPLGPNNTPDYGSIVKGLCAGAGEALGLARRAYALNVAPQEVIRGNLDQRQPRHSKELCPKHCPRSYFHVMAYFHIRDIVEAIVGHHIAP